MPRFFEELGEASPDQAELPGNTVIEGERVEVVPDVFAVRRVVVMRLLIEKEANVEAKNECGDTALHWAAFRGYRGVVRLLMKAGATTKVKNKEGHTALYYAAKHDYLPVARLLLRGADPKCT